MQSQVQAGKDADEGGCPLAVNAMYPGTFDPVTRGHEDIVRRCARLYDRVVIAIATSPKKEPLLSLDRRIALAKAVFADLPQVSVTGYEGLTVDFAKEHDLQVIVRGMRAVSDFEFEFQLATMNRHLLEDVETVFLTAADQFTFVSSSLIREIASHGGPIEPFVHPQVEQALREAFAAQEK